MNTSLHLNATPILRGTVARRGAIFGGVLIGALAAFEIFNFATTNFALTDMLGDLQTAGIRWATVLALAFCGIDFAGIARLLTPQQQRAEQSETWYLFGAWLLAAAFNAALTWWGVSVAIVNHSAIGNAIVGQATLDRTVPVVVAAMVWLIRVLIIGTFSMQGDRIFSIKGTSTPASTRISRPRTTSTQPMPRAAYAMRPAARPLSAHVGEASYKPAAPQTTAIKQ